MTTTTSARAAAASEVLSDAALAARVRDDGLVDVRAASWSVSSAKHGHGVAHLLCDGSAAAITTTANASSSATFWQSDGSLPHVVRVQFARLTPVSLVCAHLDYAKDESYTPQLLEVHAGTHDGDVVKVAEAEAHRPAGWLAIALIDGDEAAATSATTTAGAGARKATETAVWCTQLSVVFAMNHDNGRDCHVRGLRLLGPRRGHTTTAAADDATTSVIDVPLR